MTIATQGLPTDIRVDGQRLSGLLGANLLSRFGTLTLDYATSRVILGGTVPASRRAVPITVVRRRTNVLINVRASIAGASASWLLDTGSASVVIATRRAAALRLPRAGRTQTASGAGGCTAKVSPVQISRWHAGGVTLPPTIAFASNSPVITNPEPGHSTAGLIGANVLASFKEATIDFTHRRLILGGTS